MFKKLDRKRLLELAGIEPIQHGPEDRSMSPHHQEPEDSSQESTEEHLGKETEVFKKVHDALEELLDFLGDQEGFEEKRGKEDEYAEMRQDAEVLCQTMKKHLSEYPDAEKEMEDDHEDGDEEIRMVKPDKNPMNFR